MAAHISAIMLLRLGTAATKPFCMTLYCKPLVRKLREIDNLLVVDIAGQHPRSVFGGQGGDT